MYGRPCKKDIGWVAISVMEREGAGAYGPTPAPACHIIHVVTPESNRVFTVGMGGGDEGRGELLICSYPFAFQELHNRRALSFQCLSCQKIIQGIGSAKHSGRTDGPRSVANLRLGPVFIGKTTEP